MNDVVHISSVVVQVQPERLAALKTVCSTFEHVEVHAEDPRGSLVLVLETPGQREIVDTIDRLREEAGVLAVNMVYHHAESAQELDREIGDEADAT